MDGMPMKMPARTTKVCAPREWTRPPDAERNGVTSDFKKVGAKATWTVKCTGEMPMTGNGEVDFSGDRGFRVFREAQVRRLDE